MMNEKFWMVVWFFSGMWCFGGRFDDFVNLVCEFW